VPVVVTLGADGLVVAAYLGVVVCLEVEGELHQCLGDVSSDFIGNGELIRLFCAGFARHRSTVDFGLGAEALALDDDGIDLVQDTVKDGGGQGAVVVEDLRPVLVGAVGGDQHRCALIALAMIWNSRSAPCLSIGRYRSTYAKCQIAVDRVPEHLQAALRPLRQLTLRKYDFWCPLNVDLR